MKSLTITQKAYIAGLIDGEGSIGLVKHKEKKCPRGWYYDPYVSISNTSEKLMKYIKEVTGIGFYRKKQFKNFNKKWKVPLEWRVCARKEIINLLEQVLPYLIIKKKHAILLLEYLKIREQQERERIAFMKEQQIKYNERQDKIYEKLKELNKKGR